MTTKTYKLHIIMPFYGDSILLTRALDSILTQSYQDFKVIIGLDGPNENAKTIVTSFASEKIDFLEYPRRGFIKTLNDLMIYASDSDYIARMDGDDWSGPDRLEKQLQFLENNPSFAFVSCNYGFIGKNNRKVIEKRISNNNDFISLSVTDLMLNDQNDDYNFCDPGTIYRSSSAKEVGFYDIEIDNEKPLQIKLLRKYKGAVLKSPLYFCDFSLISHSRSKDNKAKLKTLAISNRYLTKDEQEFVLDKKISKIEKNRLGLSHKGLRIYLATKNWKQVLAILSSSKMIFSLKTWKIIYSDLINKSSKKLYIPHEENYKFSNLNKTNI